MSIRQRLKLIFDTLVLSLGVSLLTLFMFFYRLPKIKNVIIVMLASIVIYPHLRKSFPARAGPRNRFFFAIHMANYGTFGLWGGLKLRQLALEAGLFPTPLSEDFMIELTRRLVYWAKQWRYDWKKFKRAIIQSFDHVKGRLDDPNAPVKADFIVDRVLATTG
jgi:hypothetical protein